MSKRYKNTTMHKSYSWLKTVLFFVFGLMLFTAQSQNIKPYAGKVLFDQSSSPRDGRNSESCNIAYDLATEKDTIYGSGVTKTASLLIADDFTVPEGENWDVMSVYVNGYTQSSLMFTALHIEILSDNNGKPGALIKAFPFVTETIYNSGNMVAYLPEIVTLAEGDYWFAFSVVEGLKNDEGFTWNWSLEPDIPVLGNYSSYYYNFTENNNATSSWIIKDGSGEMGINGKGPNMSFSINGGYSHDLSITKILSPITGESLAEQTVSIRIRNLGTSPESNFRVRYKIDDNAVVEEVVNATVAAGGTYDYSFTTKADLSVAKSYNLWVAAELVNDELITNDSISTEVINYGTVYNIADVNGQTITTCTGVFVDAGGSTVDISESNDEYIVTFKADGQYKMTSLDFSLFKLPYKSSITIYDAETEMPGDSIGRWSSSTGPTEPITATNANGALTIKFTGVKSANPDFPYQDQPGWIANVSCITVADYDLSISDLTAPTSNDNMTTAENVTVAIKNLGKFDENNFNVQFSIIEANQVSATTITETVTETVQPGQVLNYTFTQTIDASEAREYNISAKTIFGSDWVPENDEYTGSFENYGLVYHINDVDNQTITTCEGRFTDEGGIDGTTVPGNYITTLQSGSSTSRIALDFNRFRINTEGDTVFIYDGIDTNAPLIGQWSGAQGLGLIKSSTAAGALTFKYVGTNSIAQSGWEANISCIDAFANDMGIAELYSPVTGEGLTTSETVKVLVKNYGYDTQSDITVSYTIYVDGEIVDTFSEPLGVILANGEQVEHTFSQAADLYIKNTYEISVKASIANDEFTDNDSVIYTVNSYGTTFRISDYHESEIVTCSGTFADDGGLGGDALKDSAYITTIRPGEDGKRIRLFFNSFYIGYDGVMAIYDGVDTTARLIGKWSYGKLSGQIKATNTSGALTINYKASSATYAEGWDADISCYEPVADDFAIIDAYVDTEPAMVGVNNNISVLLQNIGSLAQEKKVTLWVNDAETASFTTDELAGGKSDTISFPWLPEQDIVYNIMITIPVDDGEELNDTLSFQTAAYHEGSLFESFEDELFPPEFWYTMNNNWARTNEMGQLTDTVQHGEYAVVCGIDNETDADTLVTPLLNIKEGDVIRFLGMHTGGWLSFGWIDGETNEFHPIDTLIDYKLTKYNFQEYFIDISAAAGVNRFAFVGLPGFAIDRVWGPKLYLPDADMQAELIIASKTAVLDSANSFKVVLRNMGELNVKADDYSVTLYQTGTPDFPLTTVPGIDLERLQTDTLTLTNGFVFTGMVDVFAQVNIDGDANLNNNITDTVTVDVYNSGTVLIEVGDGDIDYQRVPMAMSAPYSVSQVIYTAEQIGKVGHIGGISYKNNFMEDQPGVKTKVFVGITQDTTFDNGWVDTSALTLVLDKTIDFEAGKNNLYLPFDNDFTYNGGNLLVMVYKHTPEIYYDQWFKHTETNSNTAYSVTSNNEIDLDTLELGIAKMLIPNTSFYIDSKGAALSGRVYGSRGDNLQKALVILQGPETSSVLTDEFGRFEFTDIIANAKYTVYIEAPNHEPELVSEFMVDSLNYSIGNITLNAIEIPFAVIAQTQEDKCVISWKHETEAVFDAPVLINNSIENVYSAPAGSNVYAGNLIEVTHPGTLVGVYVWAATGPGTTSNDKVHLSILDKAFKTIAVSESFYLPDQQEILIDVPYVSYNDDFYIMVHWDNINGSTNGVGIDLDGPNQLAVIGNHRIGFSKLEGTFTIMPAMLVDGGKSVARKGFLGYDIFRGAAATMGSLDSWEKINVQPVKPNNNAVTYYDYNWPLDTAGNYMYAVRSVYERDSSSFVYSNLAKYNVESTVYVELIANAGSPANATVELVNLNNMKVNEYAVSVDENGRAVIENVEFGKYNISVTHDMYESFVIAEYLIDNEVDTIEIELTEMVITPFDLKVAASGFERSAFVSWNGYNDTTQLILDDNSFESGLVINGDDVVSLGNKYETKYIGQVVSIDLFGIEYGDGGNYEVTAEIFDMEGIKIATSEPTIIAANDFSTAYFSNPVDFEGGFYAMIHWQAVGGVPNILAMDYTGDYAGRGLSYVYNENSGLFALRDINVELDGIFGIRPSIIIKGITQTKKNTKSAASTSKTKLPQLTGHVLNSPVNVESNVNNTFNIGAHGSFNVYFNNMQTPIATDVTDLYYEFTDLEYGSHEVGISANYASGETEITKAEFSILTSVDEFSQEIISVYPNPTNGLVYINTGMVKKAKLLSLKGELLHVFDVDSMQPVVDLSGYNAGVYILKLETVSSIAIKKIVISE